MQVNFVEGIPNPGTGKYLFVLEDGSICEGQIVILKPCYKKGLDQNCEDITDRVAGYLDLNLNKTIEFPRKPRYISIDDII
jgi:hypothetical protein